MTFPVKLYCQCGVKLEHKAQTQATADQYTAMFKQAHSSQGHELINETQFKQLQKTA